MDKSRFKIISYYSLGLVIISILASILWVPLSLLFALLGSTAPIFSISIVLMSIAIIYITKLLIDLRRQSLKADSTKVRQYAKKVAIVGTAIAVLAVVAIWQSVYIEGIDCGKQCVGRDYGVINSAHVEVMITVFLVLLALSVTPYIITIYPDRQK